MVSLNNFSKYRKEMSIDYFIRIYFLVKIKPHQTTFIHDIWFDNYFNFEQTKSLPSNRNIIAKSQFYYNLYRHSYHLRFSTVKYWNHMLYGHRKYSKQKIMTTDLSHCANRDILHSVKTQTFDTTFTIQCLHACRHK